MLNLFIFKIDRPVSAPTHKPHRCTTCEYQEETIASEIYVLIRRLQRQPGSELTWPSTTNYSSLKETRTIYVWKHQSKRWKSHLDKSDTYHTNPVNQSPSTTPEPRGTNAEVSLLLARNRACLVTDMETTNAGATATNDYINDGIE